MGDLPSIRTRAARADDGDGGLGAEAGEAADKVIGACDHEENRRCVSELLEQRRVPIGVTTESRDPRALEASPLDSQIATVERREHPRCPLTDHRPRQLGLREREETRHPGGRPLEETRDASGEHGDQQRSAQAGVAGLGEAAAIARGHAASRSSPSRR
jgi:hypothetical protein